MAKIKEVKATEILDSRGNPTVEVIVFLHDGSIGIADCPSGASVGTYEALELRDHDENRFRGLGVRKAIENIEKIIAPALIDQEATHQSEIDRLMLELDGTQNKGRLGANATLPVSMAVCKAAAKSSVLPLFLYIREFIKNDNTPLRVPTPLFNVLNGGKHAGSNVDFQEFIVTPASSKPFQQGLELGVSVYMMLKDILLQNNLTALIGDEGGYAPSVASNADALSLIKQAIDATTFRFGYDIFLGLDVAANSFFQDGSYHIKDKNMSLSSKDLVSYYVELFKTYPILYLEDPLAEDDWDGWINLSQKIPKDTLIVGDDLTVTNPYRLQMALDKKVITGVVVKPNQIGTVIESLAVVGVAREAGLKIIVSHRSGETNDDFIADFAVAVSSDYVKFGAPARGERVAKYNRLSHIESQIKLL